MSQQPNQAQRLQPIEALNILDQAAGMAPLSRQGHVAVQQAVQVLAKLIQEAPEGGPEAPGSAVEKKPTKRGRRGSAQTEEATADE